MLRDKLITKEDVTQAEFEHAKAIRTMEQINFRDKDLLDFYIEWNNICYKLKHTTNKKRR